MEKFQQKLDYHIKVIHENPKPKTKKIMKNSGQYQGLRNQTRKTAKAIKLSNICVDEEEKLNSVLLQDMGEKVHIEIHGE